MVVKQSTERVRRVHKEAIIIDSLECLRPWNIERAREYIKACIRAGVTAIVVTVPAVTQELPDAIKDVAKFYKLVEAIEEMKVALTAADIENAKKEGKVAVIMGMQSTIPYEKDLDLIGIFYRLGIRVMQLGYYRQAYLGSGCGERIDNGVTDTGREAIEEMNRLGIVIDVSHCGDKTATEAAEISKAPIGITHGGPASLMAIPRCRSDEAIKAIAKKGGVIGMIAQRYFVSGKGKFGERPRISDFVDSMAYLAKMVGSDHVGLGLDYTPFYTPEMFEEWYAQMGRVILYPHPCYPDETRFPVDFREIADVITFTEELLRHGYSDDETKKMMGGNWLRLFKEVLK